MENIEILGEMREGYDEILTEEACQFVAELVRQFRPRIQQELERREEVQEAFDRGERPTFPDETKEIREGDWTCGSIPEDLQDRRVEITGPTGRKMVINALNSGANVFMADFEDSNSPTWSNMVEGQINLRDAVDETITFDHPTKDKFYELADETATLMVRPRGLHLEERHFLVDGEPAPGPLFDFGLFMFHNAQTLVDKGSGPYFYLPKLENHREAGLWNDVIVEAQEKLGLPIGTVKATVLLETITASFEMDEILYELQEHSAGLNCGRWDYIFSFIKKFRNDPDTVMPDRSEVTMTQPFMRAYTQKVIQVCHRREVHAMGGMAAQIPIKNDTEANEAALETRFARPKMATTAPGSPTRGWSRSPRTSSTSTCPSRTRSTKSGRMSTSRPRSCSRCRMATERSRACATTSGSASSIWRPGCAAPGVCRCTT